MSGQTPVEPVRLCFDAYGGEYSFYLAWVRRRVSAGIRQRFRELAAGDAKLQTDLDSLDRPGAVEEYRAALEMTNYLTRDHPLTGEESITALSLAPEERSWVSEDNPSPRGQLRKLVRDALFDLLAEADLKVPPALEVRTAGEALSYIAGPEAVQRFSTLNDRLEQMRRRSEQTQPTALVRLLRTLSGDLFALEEGRYRYRLSFRLFMKGRLHDWCERAKYRPTGRRYRTLTEAFAALDRERIGELVRTAAQNSTEPLVAEEAVCWLHTAP